MAPDVSLFEWHPFSISSAPHMDEVRVHVRVLGDWTKRLYDVVSEKGGGPLELRTYWEGPYGAPQIDIESDKYKIFLLISGGIGITPMQSIANWLLHQHQVEGRPLKKIWFVWAVADKFMVGAASLDHDEFDEEEAALPFSFQPDSLSHKASTDQRLAKRSCIEPISPHPLHAEFFLTRTRKESDLRGAGIRPVDMPLLRFGRPKLCEIFGAYAAYAEVVGESRVGVLVCGPPSLVAEARLQCAQASHVAFDFHAERFQF